MRRASRERRVKYLSGAALLAAGVAAVGISCKSIDNSSAVREGAPGQTSPVLDGKTWRQVQAERGKAIDEYLSRRKTAYDWYVNSPLGVNGVPYVLLTFFMEKYPDIWKDKLGFPPHLSDYDDNGNLKPADQRRALPLGFGWTKDFDETNPARQTSNVFFACGGCHISRVLVDGKMKYFIGGPSNEVEPQNYAGLIYQTGKRLVGEINLNQLNPNAELNTMEKLDATWDKAKVAKIYAELRLHRDKLKAKSYLSKIPKLFSRGGAGAAGGGYYDSSMDKVDVVKELDMLVNDFSFFKQVMTNFIGSYIKTNTLYYEMGSKIPFRAANANDPDPEGRKQPAPIFAPKPGQMDAFGLVQGIIALNAARPDYSWWKFIDHRYGANSPIFQGAQGSGEAKYKEAQRLLAGRGFGLFEKKQLTEAEKEKDRDVVRKWFSPNGANIDIKTLWLSRDEVHSNWDGNQAAAARALSSGVSSVGDPRKVDTKIHGAMNPFIDDLPAPAYPFDVDVSRLERGKKLFEEGKGGAETCVSCHFPNNTKTYDVGTDMNRTMVTSPLGRLLVSSLAMEACELGMNRPGENKDWQIDDMWVKRDWCNAKEPGEADIYRKIDTTTKSRPEGEIGYKADPLYAIWASAPYLHNGSVPTLYALFKPSARPRTFYRGNVNYDTRDVGYVYGVADATNYPAGESKHIAPYDTTLRGNSNKGHDKFTEGWSDDEIYDLIEYLKVYGEEQAKGHRKQ